ncbi:hypothetical protein [Parapedobacter sp. DT-150]|uniref:hypothetical protein n=1 Tax=Parapedobacter sp. DT-150 TaxID=3396162 RepID=UPI003F1A4351
MMIFLNIDILADQKNKLMKKLSTYSIVTAIVALFIISCAKEDNLGFLDKTDVVIEAKTIFENKLKTVPVDTDGMSYRQKLDRTVLWRAAYAQESEETLTVFAPVVLSENLILKSGGIEGTSFNDNTWLRATRTAGSDWRHHLITLLPTDTPNTAFTGVAIVEDWFTSKSAFSLIEGGNPISTRQLLTKPSGRTSLSMVVDPNPDTYVCYPYYYETCVTVYAPSGDIPPVTTCAPHYEIICEETDIGTIPGGGGGSGGGTGSNGEGNTSFNGEDGIGETGAIGNADPDLPSNCDSWEYQPVSGGVYQACGVRNLRFDYITEYMEGNNLKIEYYRGTFTKTLYFEFPRVRANGSIISEKEAARLTAQIKDVAEEILESHVEASPPPKNTFESNAMIDRFYNILQSKMAEHGGRVSKTNHYGTSKIKDYSKSVVPCY